MNKGNSIQETEERLIDKYRYSPTVVVVAICALLFWEVRDGIYWVLRAPFRLAWFLVKLAAKHAFKHSTSLGAKSGMWAAQKIVGAFGKLNASRQERTNNGLAQDNWIPKPFVGCENLAPAKSLDLTALNRQFDN